MKTVAIIGSNGMLGSDLVQYISKKFAIIAINKENYQSHIGQSFDIVINANGNSKRFWANQNPEDDFSASTLSVIKTIFDFPCALYIYISTPDIYENHTQAKYTHENRKINPQNLEPYGFHKYLSEQIIRKYKNRHIILRSSMILGTKLKKGPFYDILQNHSLFITPETKLQLITTKAIAEIINTLLGSSIYNETINIGGIGTFNFTKIGKYINSEIKISAKAKIQIYNMNVEKLRKLYPQLKKSEDYLQEFLKSSDML